MNEILIKLISALFIGGIIGYERKSRGKPAGLITNIMVCLGATLISIEQNLLTQKSIEMITERPELVTAVKVDMGRLTAQIISGIGFLGGGVIIQTKDSVKGITTAAVLWVVAAIGISLGNGHYEIAYVTFLIVIIILVFLKKLEIIALDKRRFKKVYLEYYESKDIEEILKKTFKDRSVRLSGKTTHNRLRTHGKTLLKETLILNIPRYINSNLLIKDLRKNEEILLVRLEEGWRH